MSEPATVGASGVQGALRGGSSRDSSNPPAGLLRTMLGIGAVVAIQAVSPTIPDLTFVLLAGWALMGGVESLQALSLAWLISFLNPTLVARSGSLVYLRWLVLFGALFRALVVTALRRGTRAGTILGATGFMTAMIALATLMASRYPLLSFAKLLVVTGGIATAVLLASQIDRQKRRLERWLQAFFITILLLSIPTLASHVGYELNGRGFQGILSHPQSFGVFLAPVVVWMASRAGFRTTESRWSAVWAVVATVMLVLTRARTGLIALAGGSAVAMLVYVWRRFRGRARTDSQSLRGFVYLSLAWLSVLSAVLMIFVGPVSVSLERYLIKGYDTRSIASSLWLSRGRLIENSWNQFRSRPWSGIGFGIQDPSGALKDRSLRLGAVRIPVAAPTEKGFLPTGLLGEVGVIGCLGIVVFVLVLVRELVRRSGVKEVCLVATCLFVNVGESVFFSFGGMGLYLWIVLAYVLTGRE